MGVKRLAVFLHDHPEATTSKAFPLPDKKRANVLIDTFSISAATYGYAALLGYKGHHYPYIHPDTDILGGEALILKTACRSILTAMRSHCRMNIALLHDATRFAAPPTTSTTDDVGYAARNEELERRVNERVDRLRQHFRYACGEALNKDVSRNNKGAASLPPQRFSTILQAVVEEVNAAALVAGEDASTLISDVRVAPEDGEVDAVIGRLVAAHKADLVISSDSDLIVINHGCAVSLTADLPWDTLILEGAHLPETIEFRTTSHADLCRVLGIAPSAPSATANKIDLVEQFLSTNNSAAGDSLLLYIACGLNGNDVTQSTFEDLHKGLGGSGGGGGASASSAGGKGGKGSKKGGKGNKASNEGAAAAAPESTATAEKSEREKKREAQLLTTPIGQMYKSFLDLTNATSVSGGSASEYAIVDRCRRLVGLRAAARKENAKDAPATICLRQLLSNPLLTASTNQYLAAANTSSAAPAAGNNANANFAPHLAKNRAQLDQLMQLYNDRVIAPSALVAVVDGLLPIEKRDPLAIVPYTSAGCPKAFSESKTVRRFDDLSDALVLAQRRDFGVNVKAELAQREDDMRKHSSSPMMRNNKASKADGNADWDSDATSEEFLPLPKCSWVDVLNRPAADRVKIFNGLFEPSNASAVAAISATAAPSTGAFAPTAPEALLWLAHPLLYDDELRVMAAMLSVMALPAMEQQAITAALAEACNSEVEGNGEEGGGEADTSEAAKKKSKKQSQLTKKATDYWKSRGVEGGNHRTDHGHTIPAARALMMSHLVSDSIAKLSHVASVLGFASLDTLFASGGPHAATHLITSYSGSLLHYLYEKRAALEKLTCLKAVIASSAFNTMIGNVTQSAEAFRLVEEAKRNKIMKTRGDDDGSADEAVDDDENTLGFGCRGASSKAEGVTGGDAASGWVGMLHRDELADLMDDGDTEVIAGGVVVGSNRLDRMRKNPNANIIASAATALQARGEPPLPILEHMPKILRTVQQNNVVCIQGETGCGKSSMIPLEIYRDAVSRGEHVNIIVTQPRRLAARSLADRVASLLGQKVGDVVGYRMGGGTEFHCDSKNTRIRFVTTGYLLESLISHSSAWDDVTHYILDEVHERSLDADMLSLVLKVMLGEKLDLSLDELQDLDASCPRWDEAKAITEADLDRLSRCPVPAISLQQQQQREQQLQREGRGGKQQQKGKNGKGGDNRLRTIDDDSDDRPGSFTVTSSKPSENANASASNNAAAVVVRNEKGCKMANSKVVVMSATIQAKLFQTYFSPLMQDKLLAPNVFVGAKRFPVQEYFLDEFIEAFPQLPERVKSGLVAYNSKAGRDKPPSLRGETTTALVDVALASVRPGTAILIFLPGLDEIETVVEQLQTINDNTPTLVCKLRVFAVHSVVDVNDQANSIKAPEDNECNIIVATNIAETSLTIPDLRIVIDAGMSKRMTHDAQRNIRMLMCGWCSKSAAKQRAGRTGRVGTGMVVRMYPKNTFTNFMPDFDPSEFYPLEYSVLQVRHHLSHFGTIQDVMGLLIEPPEPEEIDVAIGELVKIGALDEGEHVTSFGRVALRMPVDLRMTKGLMAAAALGCAAEMVVIVAGISMQKAMFARPIRPFFNTETEFLTAVVSVASTSSRFERIPQSDIHTFLSLFAFAQLPRNTQVKLINQVERADVAFRSLGTFAKSCRTIANSLLGLNLKFHPEDEVFLSKITAFGGHKRGVISSDDEDEDEEEVVPTAATGNKKPLPPKKPTVAPSLFPWEFRAMTTGSHNALLQVALAAASDCQFDLTCASKKDKAAAKKKPKAKKAGKKGKGKNNANNEEEDDEEDDFPPIPEVASVLAQLRSQTPALAALPRATIDAMDPSFLNVLLEVEPIGFLACTPAKLPFYLTRTIVFKLPPRLQLMIREEFDRKSASSAHGDFSLRPAPPKRFTAMNSNVVAQYEAVFTKLCSDVPATLTVALTTNRVVLSIGLKELGLSGYEATQGYKDPTSTAAKITILKRGKVAVPTTDAPAAGTGAAAAPNAAAGTGGSAAAGAATATAAAPVAPAVDPTDVPFVGPARLQLMVLHPAIRGLLMARVLHRTRTILVPITAPNLTSGEGEAFELKDVQTVCKNYTMIIRSESVSGSCNPDRWSALCTPDTIPIVPLAIQDQFAKTQKKNGADPDAVIPTMVSQRETLSGVCFGLMSLGERNLAVAQSLVVGGSALQLMLTLLCTSVVSNAVLDRQALNVFLTYVPQRSITRVPTFISGIANINLQNSFNSTETSTTNSAFGAPLHGLVSYLAACLLLHISKSPTDFQREKLRLLKCITTLDSLSAYLPDEDLSAVFGDDKKDGKAKINNRGGKRTDDVDAKKDSTAAVTTASAVTKTAAAAPLLDDRDFDLLSYSSRLELSFDAYRFSDQSVCFLPNLEKFFETDMFVGEDGYDEVLPKAASKALVEVYSVMERICRYESPEDAVAKRKAAEEEKIRKAEEKRQAEAILVAKSAQQVKEEAKRAAKEAKKAEQLAKRDEKHALRADAKKQAAAYEAAGGCNGIAGCYSTYSDAALDKFIASPYGTFDESFLTAEEHQRLRAMVANLANQQPPQGKTPDALLLYNQKKFNEAANDCNKVCQRIYDLETGAKNTLGGKKAQHDKMRDTRLRLVERLGTYKHYLGANVKLVAQIRAGRAHGGAPFVSVGNKKTAAAPQQQQQQSSGFGSFNVVATNNNSNNMNVHVGANPFVSSNNNNSYAQQQQQYGNGGGYGNQQQYNNYPQPQHQQYTNGSQSNQSHYNNNGPTNNYNNNNASNNRYSNKNYNNNNAYNGGWDDGDDDFDYEENDYAGEMPIGGASATESDAEGEAFMLKAHNAPALPSAGPAVVAPVLNTKWGAKSGGNSNATVATAPRDVVVVNAASNAIPAPVIATPAAVLAAKKKAAAAATAAAAEPTPYTLSSVEENMVRLKMKEIKDDCIPKKKASASEEEYRQAVQKKFEKAEKAFQKVIGKFSSENPPTKKDTLKIVKNKATMNQYQSVLKVLDDPIGSAVARKELIDAAHALALSSKGKSGGAKKGSDDDDEDED